MTNDPKSGEANLLPCPFCGSNTPFISAGQLYCHGQCGMCGATSSAQTSDAKARKAWNTRAESELAALRTRNEELEAEKECEGLEQALRICASIYKPLLESSRDLSTVESMIRSRLAIKKADAARAKEAPDASTA